MVRNLYEYEGLLCLWRLPAAGLTFLMVGGLPVVAAVVIAVLTIPSRVVSAAVSAVIVLAFNTLRQRIQIRCPWRLGIERRLWTYEKPNPRSEVRVLLRSTDIPAVCTALRAAKFNPWAYGVKLPASPEDAPDYDYKIGVHEPEAWMQSSSDVERMDRIVEVLRRAGLRTRIGEVDTMPS
jgi:hypothetical protein